MFDAVYWYVGEAVGDDGTMKGNARKRIPGIGSGGANRFEGEFEGSRVRP
jgi:hypothetical protein